MASPLHRERMVLIEIPDEQASYGGQLTVLAGTAPREMSAVDAVRFLGQPFSSRIRYLDVKIRPTFRRTDSPSRRHGQ